MINNVAGLWPREDPPRWLARSACAVAACAFDFAILNASLAVRFSVLVRRTWSRKIMKVSFWKTAWVRKISENSAICCGKRHALRYLVDQQRKEIETESYTTENIRYEEYATEKIRSCGMHDSTCNHHLKSSQNWIRDKSIFCSLSASS